MKNLAVAIALAWIGLILCGIGYELQGIKHAIITAYEEEEPPPETPPQVPPSKPCGVPA